MLSRLAASELTVGELAEPLAMSLAAASKHVKALERAGLVRRSVEGRRHVCRLEPGPLAAAAAWLRFHEGGWHERLDALEALFRAGPKPEPQGGSERGAVSSAARRGSGGTGGRRRAAAG